MRSFLERVPHEPVPVADEMDDFGRQAGGIMRNIIQLAALGALRLRERGQLEAESRVANTNKTNAAIQEGRLRAARDAKANDPRHVILDKIMDEGAKAAVAERGIDLTHPTGRAALQHTVEIPVANQAPIPTVPVDGERIVRAHQAVQEVVSGERNQSPLAPSQEQERIRLLNLGHGLER